MNRRSFLFGLAALPVVGIPQMAESSFERAFRRYGQRQRAVYRFLANEAPYMVVNPRKCVWVGKRVEWAAWTPT